MSAPRVVALVRDEPAARGFIARLHAAAPLAAVFVELSLTESAAHRLGRLFLQRGLPGFVGALLRRIDAAQQRPREHDDVKELIGPAAQRWPDGLPVHHTTDLHAPEVVDAIRTLAPDVIAIHGTRLLREPLLSLAPHVVNLHWGLAPHYRGVRCIEQALLARDVLNLGITLHRPSARIDGGAIYTQMRIPIEASDTAHRLALRHSLAGAEALAALVKRLAAGELLHPIAQHLDQGRLYRIADFTLTELQQLRRLERAGLHRLAPARPPLPLITI